MISIFLVEMRCLRLRTQKIAHISYQSAEVSATTIAEPFERGLLDRERENR